MATNLDGSLYSFEHSQAHDGPGYQQTAHHVRIERARLVNRVCDVQSSTVPEVRCGGALFTLHH